MNFTVLKHEVLPTPSFWEPFLHKACLKTASPGVLFAPWPLLLWLSVMDFLKAYSLPSLLLTQHSLSSFITIISVIVIIKHTGQDSHLRSRRLHSVASLTVSFGSLQCISNYVWRATSDFIPQDSVLVSDMEPHSSHLRKPGTWDSLSIFSPFHSHEIYFFIQ